MKTNNIILWKERFADRASSGLKVDTGYRVPFVNALLASVLLALVAAEVDSLVIEVAAPLTPNIIPTNSVSIFVVSSFILFEKFF